MSQTGGHLSTRARAGRAGGRLVTRAAAAAAVARAFVVVCAAALAWPCPPPAAAQSQAQSPAPSRPQPQSQPQYQPQPQSGPQSLPQSQPVYRNPVVAGDFPDPTVIRVGEEYWAAVTTGSWAPHFTLLRSRDLVNWQAAGAVFARRPAWAKGDFWAPELVEHRGRFHVYYTARRNEGERKTGTLCVAVATAPAPGGPYQDHGPLVCQIPELKNVGSIDAFLVRDEQGAPHLVWKADGNDAGPGQPTPIFAQPLSADGLKLQGKRREILRNTEAWERHVTEGSYITRRGGWLYHFYSGNACCGRGCDYALGVARARTLYGPWEKHPRNPILKANSEWQCPGHGTIVETPGGRLFMLYHSYRSRPWTFSVGREALLDEVVWGEDGWPSINGGAGPSSAAPAPLGVAEEEDEGEFFDDFTAEHVGPEWQWPMSAEPATLRHLAGRLLLTAPPGAREGDEWAAAVVGLRTRSADYVATAAAQMPRQRDGANPRAGLSAYSWRQGAVGIALGPGRVFVWRRENQARQTLAEVMVGTPAGAEPVQLRMTAEGGETYRFAYSLDGREWLEVGGAVAGGHVEGARVALTVGGPAGSTVNFDWLRITPRR